MPNRYYVPISAGAQFRGAGRILFVWALGLGVVIQGLYFFHHEAWRYPLFLTVIPAIWFAWRSAKNGWRVWCAQWRVRLGR